MDTLHFFPTPAGVNQLVLGVLVSQAPKSGELSFSVPAHVLLTLNHVQGGTLSLNDQALFASFATGPQRRSRRYRISPGAVLVTLFCRADGLPTLCSRSVRDTVDQWLDPRSVFGRWVEPQANASVAQISDAMFSCVSPELLPPNGDRNSGGSKPSIAAVLRALRSGDLALAAASLRLSERALQRYFIQYLGVSPKLVQRMLRIQRCVELWGSDATRAPGLADLAAEVGLADQAHLAREFRELVGYPPSALKRPVRSSTGAELEDTLWALRTGNSLLAPLLLQD